VIVGENGDETTILSDKYLDLGNVIKNLNAGVTEEEKLQQIKFVSMDLFDRSNFVLLSSSKDGKPTLHFSVPHNLQESAEELKSTLERSSDTSQQQLQVREANDQEDGNEEDWEDADDADDNTISSEELAEFIKNAGKLQEIIEDRDETIAKAVEIIEDRDATIATYEETVQTYKEALEITSKVLNQKIELIAEYETLLERMRDQRQSDAYGAATAIREANERANADFALRQRLQALQFNSQVQNTAMMNMGTQFSVAMQNMSSYW